MITPRASAPDPAAVGGHYDALDETYRRVWGEHVHHGLWADPHHPREAPEEAAAQLVRHVAFHARIRPDDAVCDVGCGYGAPARLLAAERGARVTGFTLSTAQVAAAPLARDVELRVRDWLANGLPDASFDAVIAIESLSHMPDKPRAFAELGRVVKPGGRVVLTDWLAAEHPTRRAQRLLLEPICREGHLPSLHSFGEYAALLRDAGLEVVATEDLTARARHTWTVVAERLPREILRDPSLLRTPEWRFGLSLARIPIAMRAGAMRLGLLAAQRPAG